MAALAKETMAEASEQKPTVTLYWLDQSRSQRILWLLEECKGIDYKIEVFKRGKDMLAPAEMKKIHPLGKSPIIKVEAPNAEPLIIAESGFMVEYLCEHFAPHLIPKRYQDGKDGQVGGETEEWLRYRYYMHYAEGSLMSMLLIALFMDQIRNAPVPFFIKPITRGIAGRVDTMFLNENFKTTFSFLESQIASSPGGGKYICGTELTAADILMSFPLILASESKIDAKAYPKLSEYIKRLNENEVHKRSEQIAKDSGGGKVRAQL